ncbi:MAG: hypothetical protein IPK50_00690 [Fibrobacterota bacterium]|nr:MAG: hypothetical protein IPK50_00690 [Fibrobacterota bacterium]
MSLETSDSCQILPRSIHPKVELEFIDRLKETTVGSVSAEVGESPATSTSIQLNPTNWNLYARTKFTWKTDSLVPRPPRPIGSDTGSHPGWIRTVAKWNFTVGDLQDSVMAVGWLPDPEFTSIAPKSPRKSIGSKARVDALGRPAVLRHQASDVRLIKP